MMTTLRYTLVTMLLCVVIPQLLVAAPTFTSSAAWTAAQAGRTWMDIGGVWNGTIEVTATTGDSVSLVINNTAGTPAYELSVSTSLATGFNYVAGTASVAAAGAGCGAAPTVTASQTGSVLSFTLLPAGYDLPVACALTFQYGITTASTVIAGTYQMNHQWDYATVNAGALTGTPSTRQLNILVYAGASIISKLPSNQLQAVGATAAWNISINNTGLGGLFDVSVDEYTINPSTALSFSSIAVTAPVSPTATTPTPTKRVLPYLAPGISFDTYVQASVLSCRDINNNAYTTDRTGTTTDVGTAQVTLNMLLPLVAFTVPNYSVPYTSTTPVSITINNTGAGASANFTLQSQLNTLGVTVSNVAAGWSYNSGNGLFTYTANAGTIANAASVTLTFDLGAANVCTFAGGSNLKWTAVYTDVCGNAYAVPIVLSNIGTSTGAPSISLTKTSADSRLVVDTYSSFSLGFSATNTALISGTSFSVSDTLPAGISNITVTPPTGTSYSCPGGAVCNPGDILTWTVPKTALPLATAMLIDYKAPADNCVGGSVLTNTATVAATSTASCALSANASAGPLMTNNPGATVTQRFDVGLPLAGAAFETGIADNGNTTRNASEGEFIPFTAIYIYDVGYTGKWSGSSYVDNFGGLAGGGATLVSGSLAVKVDNGGSLTVPNASVTCTTGTIGGNTCAGSLTIDLAFLAGGGYFNDPYVAAHQLNIDYSTTASDANLGAGTAVNYTQLVTLTINGGGAGGCNTGGTPTYTQGAFVSIARAAATLAVAIPSTIDICQPLSVTLTAGNGTEEFPNNLLATMLTTGSYEYPTGQTPVYDGTMFTTGNMTYAENAGTNPTYALTPNTTLLNSNGTISFLARLKAGSTTTPAPLQATLDYDDYQTAGGARNFTSNGQFTPALIRQGQLVITVTPQLYTVIDSYAEWKIYITNVSSGTAYATELINTLPAGISLDTTATDAANAGQSCAPLGNCNASFVNPSVTWQLGDIPAGTTRIITLKAQFTGTTCSIPDGSNNVTARWGCGGVFHEIVVKNEPNFIFPTGQMQVVHDTTATSAPLCGTGKDVIIVRNTGKPNIFNVVASEAMNPVTSGLDIVLGTVQFSTDSGATWSATGNPTGAGTTASPYQWDKTIIPSLGDLSSVTGAGISEVRIRFDINAGEAANLSPTIQASATGSVACGDVVNSPGTPYAIPVSKPNFTVSKSGINRTVAGGAIGSGTYVGQVYGGVGDVVEWKVDLANNGDYTAFNVRLRDVFAGSGGTAQVVQAPTGYPASPSAFVDGNVYTVPNVPATTTHSYYIQETLGNTCVGWVNNANTADMTWGCVSNGASVMSNLTTPTTNTATANLVMLPGFADFATLPNTQTITYLSSGRAQVDVNFFNGGAVAINPILRDDALNFPSNMRFDPYASPPAKVTGTAVASPCTTGHCLDGTVTVGGTGTAPTFTLNGTGMRNGTSGTLTFFLYPTLYDDQYATVYPDLVTREPNATSGILDPHKNQYGGNHWITLDANSTCNQPQLNTSKGTINPLMPDMDFTWIASKSRIMGVGEIRDFTFTIKNVGETGSVADNVSVSFPVLGNGFVVNDVYVDAAGQFGWNGTCWQVSGVWTCTRDHMGFFVRNVDIGKVRVNVTVLDNGSPLSMLAEMVGEVLAADRNTSSGTILGTSVGNYSLDHARPRILGASVLKVLNATSETFTTGNNVAIGEELNYQISGRFFGGDPAFTGGNTISAITFRDTLPPGMGLVSLAATPDNAVTVSTITGTAMPAGSTPLKTGTVDFNLADITTGFGTFDYYTTTRILNIASNTDGNSTNAQIRNSFGGQLTYLGQSFRSNNTADGFTGGTATANLHAQHRPRIRRPTVTIVKEVRNVTTNSAWGPESGVNGGDTYEYRIKLTTTGSSNQVKAFDLSLVDTLPAKLILLDNATDGVDNDGDGTVDDANEGTFTAGAGGSILFNDANTLLPNGKRFSQLNRNQTITLKYRAIGDTNAIIGGDVLINSASATYTSLPGVTGNMTNPYGAPGDTYGELSQDIYASAKITMARVSGWVYLDGNQNSVHDGFEGGTALTLYAKIISAGTVLEVQPVDPTTGRFAFGTAAAGSYTVIVDDNNNTADVTPTIPASWIGTEAPTQTRSFTLGAGGSANAINFGLFNGTTTFFNGTVFEDNGLAGGTANDGIQNGGEIGIPAVIVTLTDCYATTYATSNTDGAGLFSLTLFNGVVVDGSTLCLEETNPINYLSTGGNAGTTTAGSYDRTLDRQTFTLVLASTSTSITFADIAPNTFLTDGTQMALPGTTVVYPHTFNAGTGGSVSFASSFVPSPTIPGWANVLYQDNNCDQALDAADTQVTAAIPLVAAGTICLLQKQFVPLNAPYNARNLITLTASFDYTGAVPALPVATYIRNDLTTVGQQGLVLIKTVDKSTALPGDIITYTITYSNPTSAALGNLIIHDSTPAYTTFNSMACGTLPANLSLCTKVNPGVGVNGSLQWQMTGTLAPLSSGSVSYSVKVAL